jgi:hypothetical protein
MQETRDATQTGCALHRPGGEMRRMEKRTDPWGDFLRRILLSAGLASAAAVSTASAGTDAPQAEVSEAEPQPEAPSPAAKA